VNKSFMTFMCTEWDVATIAAKAAAFGYEGVEIRSQGKHAHGLEADAPPQRLAEAKQIFTGAGVALCCVATSCRFAYSDPGERQQNIEATLRHADLAEALGAPVIRVFGGAPSEGNDHTEGKQNVIESLGQLADALSGRPIVVALETHDDYCSAIEVGDILEQVDSPHIQANYDIMHPCRVGESLDDSLDALRGRVAHTHIHDGLLDGMAVQMCPLGEGQIPNAEAMRRLLADGYDGFFSLEYMGADWDRPDELLPQFATQLRQIEAQIAD